MADILKSMAVVNASTAGGNQVIPLAPAGASFTPKAIRITAVGDFDAGTAALANHLRMSVGFSDGTNDVLVFSLSENAQGRTDTKRFVSTGACVLYTNSAGTIAGKGAVSSFGSDQVTINWITTPTSAFEMMIEAFGGADLTAAAGNFAPSTSSNGDVTIETGIDFSANNWLGFFGLTDQTLSETVGNDALISVGAAVGTATDGSAQGCSTYSEDDNNANGVPDPRVVGNAVAEAVDNTKTLVYSLRVQAETAAGLTIRTIQGSGLPAASTIAIYLILEVGATHGAFAGLKARPTATGNWAVTGFGFEPDYAGIGWIHDVAAEAVGYGFSGFIGSGNGKEASFAGFADDGAATTSTLVLARDGKALNIRDASSTSVVEIEATWSSFDAGGFTLNVATYGTSGTQDWLVWGLEKPSAAGATGTGAQSLPALGQAGSGGQTFAASGAQALPATAQAASGTHTETASGSAVQTLPAAVQSSAGLETIAGTGASELPAAAQAGSGTQEIPGSSAQTLPAAATQAFGGETLSGAGAQVAPNLTQSGSGAEILAGTGVQSLPSVAQAATGTHGDGTTGTGVQSLPSAIQSAAGAEAMGGTAAQALPMAGQDASGAMGLAAVADSFLPGLRQAGSAAILLPGVAALMLPAVRQSAASTPPSTILHRVALLGLQSSASLTGVKDSVILGGIKDSVNLKGKLGGP
jgi:hypothetical protein